MKRSPSSWTTTRLFIATITAKTGQALQQAPLKSLHLQIAVSTRQFLSSSCLHNRRNDRAKILNPGYIVQSNLYWVRPHHGSLLLHLHSRHCFLYWTVCWGFFSGRPRRVGLVWAFVVRGQIGPAGMARCLSPRTMESQERERNGVADVVG